MKQARHTYTHVRRSADNTHAGRKPQQVIIVKQSGAGPAIGARDCFPCACTVSSPSTIFCYSTAVQVSNRNSNSNSNRNSDSMRGVFDGWRSSNSMVSRLVSSCSRM